MPGFYKSGNWNENNLNPLSRINWRASLVPAAAVIPAPIAYTRVAAVKKLVVVPLGRRRVGIPLAGTGMRPVASSAGLRSPLALGCRGEEARRLL